VDFAARHVVREWKVERTGGGWPDILNPAGPAVASDRKGRKKGGEGTNPWSPYEQRTKGKKEDKILERKGKGGVPNSLGLPLNFMLHTLSCGKKKKKKRAGQRAYLAAHKKKQKPHKKKNPTIKKKEKKKQKKTTPKQKRKQEKKISPKKKKPPPREETKQPTTQEEKTPPKRKKPQKKTTEKKNHHPQKKKTPKKRKKKKAGGGVLSGKGGKMLGRNLPSRGMEEEKGGEGRLFIHLYSRGKRIIGVGINC